MKRRVVVTGMGVVTSIGFDLDSFFEHLVQGVSGEKDIQGFDTRSFPFKRAYEVQDFNARQYRVQLMDPFIQYAIAATQKSIEDSGFDIKAADLTRVGISVSSSKGGVHTLDRFRERFEKHPSAILGARVYSNLVPNFAAQWIARRWKIKGAAKCYVAACATGTAAIIEGARMIQDNALDQCVAGASDASIVPVILAGYRNMKAMSKGRMKPYDRNRSGFLVGEGAGIVFLESLESATARGAKIYGEVAGFSHGCDGSDTLNFSKEAGGLCRVLQNLLSQTGLQPEDIGYVNLHGTATQAGDAYETHQVKKAFGKKAYDIPMSSIKSLTGHMLGASGAVEIIASLLAMQKQILPPTLGLEDPDPECDLDYIPHQAREASPSVALSLSMGFGGQINAVILKKV